MFFRLNPSRSFLCILSNVISVSYTNKTAKGLCTIRIYKRKYLLYGSRLNKRSAVLSLFSLGLGIVRNTFIKPARYFFVLRLILCAERIGGQK